MAKLYHIFDLAMGSCKMPQRKSKPRTTKKDRRTERHADLTACRERLHERAETIRMDQQRAEMLTSVANGLYTELEKLSKKAPVDQATDLVVEHVNDVVADVRALIPDDAYVQRINPFVPAGDNPEHRDVVLVLQQLLQGLGRCVKPLSDRANLAAERIGLTDALIVVLELYIEHGETRVTEDSLKVNKVTLPSGWLTGAYGDKIVSLDRVDSFEPSQLLEGI